MKKFLLSFCIVSSSLFVFSEDTVSDIFKPNYKNQLFMDVEVALAEAQSELEIIPSLGLQKKFHQKLISNIFLKRT